MEKLIAELTRLYLPERAGGTGTSTGQPAGPDHATADLLDGDGRLRAIVLPFNRQDGDADAHWRGLCAVANALQAELGFSAPAVSVSGADGYRLWVSLETAVPAGTAQEFASLLRQAFAPQPQQQTDPLLERVELPPCLHQGSGKWAAFIHPGMGASFAEECGLEMAPSPAGQLGFLEGLQSVSAARFADGLALLRMRVGATSSTAAPANGCTRGVPDGLLLKDATLEDIVRFLHSKNIEPTFRHLIQADRSAQVDGSIS